MVKDRFPCPYPPTRLLRRASALPLCLALLTLASPVYAAVRLSEARNVEVPIFGNELTSPVAVVHADRVFSEDKKMGFFRVRLWPMLVADGIRVDFTSQIPNTNWPATFRVNLAPLIREGKMEWRNVSVWVTNETSPRVQAKVLTPPANAGGEFCALEDVTLRSGSKLLSVAHARLLLDGPPGRIIWETPRSTVQCDIFSGKTFSVPHKPNDKPNPESGNL